MIVGIRLTLAAVALSVVALAAACSGDDEAAGPPVATATSIPTATPEPTPEPTVTPAPTATPEPTATATPAPTATPTPTPVPALARGVSDDVIRLAVLKSGSVFGDVEVGVRARLSRVNADGGVAGRTIELVEVVDDGADVEVAIAEARRLVDTGDIFGVVLASAVPAPELTAVFEDATMPFFGWGFAPGFCAPNTWGFGVNGCAIAGALGLVPGVEMAARSLIDQLAGADATVSLVVSGDAAGTVALRLAEDVWAERLGATFVDAPDASIAEEVAAAGADVVLLSVPMDRAIALKGELRELGVEPVVDDVAYLPGLLADFGVAAQLEDGYSITQFPPQEEYRDITALISTDVSEVGDELIYSQAVSIGWWSADLAVALLDAVGADLDTASFHRSVIVDGVLYDPAVDGGLCPIETTRIHDTAAGGAALIEVEGGIYFPSVRFDCY